MQLNKIKKTLLGLGLVLSLASCGSMQTAKNSDLDSIVKNNIISKSVSYNTYESKLGYTTVFKQEEKFEQGMANPEIVASSKVFDSKGMEVDLTKEILTPEKKELYRNAIQTIVSENKNGVYYSDITVNLDDANVILLEDQIIFVFPYYSIAPRQAGMPQFIYQLVK